jgi:hypothetical protein
MRLFPIAAALCLMTAVNANCQCGCPSPLPVYSPPMPVYVGPIWGAPVPMAVSAPALPVAPILPKPKSVEEPSKENRIPKTDLPVEAKPDTTPKSPAKAFEEYVIPGSGRKRAEVPAEVKVGFFNHTGRDLELNVGSDVVKLPKDQYVTLKLPRSFTWGEKGTKTREAKIPDDAEGLEIVLRQ